MLHRLDTLHLEYPTAPSPACKPSPSTRGTLNLAADNTRYAHEKVVNPWGYKESRATDSVPCRALKLASPITVSTKINEYPRSRYIG